MPRKTALLISGMVTAFALMVVIGLAYGANRFGPAPAAAEPANTTATSTTRDVQAQLADENNTNDDTSDVARLQAEVQAYKTQLEQAYSELQQAYDQIQALSNNQGRAGRFRGGDDGRQSGGQGQQGLFSGD